MSGEKVKHRILWKIVKLYLASATTTCSSLSPIYRGDASWFSWRHQKGRTERSGCNGGIERSIGWLARMVRIIYGEFGGHTIFNFWKWQKRSSRTTSSGASQSSNRSKGKHHLFIHFSMDPSCEICKRTKITRAACRRNSKSHIHRATKFGDIITADYKILNEGESRNNQKYAIVVQDLATQWIHSHPYETKVSQETMRNLRQFLP